MVNLHGLVICNKWPQESVPLEKFGVHAVIINNNADVTCGFSYKNSTSEIIETDFVFPLESTAAVYHLEALIGEKRLVANCRERIEVVTHILKLSSFNVDCLSKYFVYPLSY